LVRVNPGSSTRASVNYFVWRCISERVARLPKGFLMKDVLFLVASFYLPKQDQTARAALEIIRKAVAVTS
jgi:hypothetical protein